MELEKIINGITAKRNEMVKRHAKDNPVIMSEIMVELAQLSHFLGEKIADEWLEMRRFKADKFHEYKAEGNSISASETLTRNNRECIAKEAYYTRLENIDKRTGLLISACQSHMRMKGREASTQL